MKNQYLYLIVVIVILAIAVAGWYYFSSAGRWLWVGEGGGGGFDFSLSENPTSGTAIIGKTTAKTSITATFLSGDGTQRVQLLFLGCPSTCYLSQPNYGYHTFSSTLYVTPDSGTSPGTYTIKISGYGGDVTRSITYNLTLISS